MTILFFLTFLGAGQYQMQNLFTFEQKLRFAFFYLYVSLILLFFIILPNPRETGFTRVIYKFLYAAAATYLIYLIFICTLDRETLRSILILLDPILAEKPVNRSYSTDCRLYTPENPTSKFANLVGTFDLFVTAHFMGWLVKSLIYRNNIIIWSLSIGFEILEMSLKQYLPNFHECWWDHLLLDLFGCNLLGILIGNWVLKKFNMRKYHWFFEPNEESEKQSYF